MRGRPSTVVGQVQKKKKKKNTDVLQKKRLTIEETFLDSSYTHVSYQFANETFSDVLLPFLSTQLNQLVDEIPGSAILYSDIARINILTLGF